MKKMSAIIDYKNIPESGSVRHFHWVDSRDECLKELPNPVSLNIVEEDGGFFLLRMDENGQCISDTWHISLDDAKRQAMFEFSIGDFDWKERV